MKLVDTLDLGSSALRCAGSSPVPGISQPKANPYCFHFFVGSVPRKIFAGDEEMQGWPDFVSSNTGC